MKYIKNAFIISLLSFLFICVVVLAYKKPKVVETVPVLTTQNNVDSRCIIVVNGVNYDITKYKYLHTGGDIFKCGTDMSATFYNQHSSSFLKQMQKYKI